MYPHRIATVVFCVLLASHALAHPGHDHHTHESDSQSLRTWTDDTGFFQIQGAFVMAKDGKVQVRKQDDTLTTLPIKRLSAKDQEWINHRLAELARLNTQGSKLFVAQVGTRQTRQKSERLNAPAIQKHFEAFEDKLKFRWDREYFYVESNGIPDHNMMVGITAWQQQVPIPQPYTGNNAWRIPLYPVPAKKPMSAKTNFFRGAIALAVNGVPIFNPIKNDGRTDTLLAGELDKWGGHCGRADDYHYHIAPVHLEEKVGKGNPVAYALDGYPIYGYQDPKADDYAELDWLNGHKDSEGNYHYHATKKYPYLNGGFYGEVVQRGGQVDPQPRAQGVRPYTRPLRGAKITGFALPEPNSYSLTYELRGEKGNVSYTIAKDGSVTFNFVDATGTQTKTYQPRERSGGGGGRKPKPKGRSQSGGPKPGDRPRQPWILVHAKEIDSNEDGIISRDEMVGEATRSFAGYDKNNDGKLTEAEYTSRTANVRSAMGGFIRGHAKELDRDNDGNLSKQEVIGSAERMFAKVDMNDDEKITNTELGESRRKR